MFEKEIILEGVDLLDFFGVKNAKLELIRSFFPKLKIVGRGNLLKVSGNEEEINRFVVKIDVLINHYHKYHKLPNDFISQAMIDDTGTLEQHTEQDGDTLLYGNTGKPVKARTPNQRELVKQCIKKDLVFAIGPAGTGKTYTAIAMAVRALKNREIKRIVLSRPAVEAGERLGFLPGDIKEKIDPYLQPLYDALLDMIPPKKLEEFIKDGVIQIAPLAFMRGRTLSNAFVILDEAQNTTENQLKMFLTRMGINAKFIITGDITQIDLPNKQHSGLIQALKILKEIKEISVVKFDKGDIVRHKLVRHIVEAYDKYNSFDIELSDKKRSKPEKS